MEQLFGSLHRGSKSRLSNAVSGGGSEADIRELLLATGIQAFRQMAGYIPAVMSLDNEPKKMLKDWRSCLFRTRFSDYHRSWVAFGFFLGDPDNIPRVSGMPIPWSDVGAHDECCQVSRNACSLSRRNKLRFD